MNEPRIFCPDCLKSDVKEWGSGWTCTHGMLMLHAGLFGRDHDWFCQKCEVFIYGHKQKCRCGFEYGDWKCGSCGEYNFKRRTECRRCKGKTAALIKVRPFMI